MGKKPNREVGAELPQSSGIVYQMKITLKGIRPPIWRRFQVPQNTSLEEFHVILHTVMGWTGRHLHEFIAAGEAYGDPVVTKDEDLKSEKGYVLSQLVRGEKDRLYYMYDYRDYWEHELLVEKIVPGNEKSLYPICVAGKRACPPENCGGPSGYNELLKSLMDPSHPDHEESFYWLPGDFDSEKFDVDAVNKKLRLASTRAESTWERNPKG